MSDWSWVTPRIALGSAPTAADLHNMERQGITDVLDLRGEPNQGETGPQPDMYWGTGIDYHYVPMRDRGGMQPVAVYQQAVAVIQDVMSNPLKKLLLHCAAGQFRSPSVLYAYLRTLGMSPGDAWSLIRMARPIVQDQYVSSAERAVPYLPAAPTGSTGSTIAVAAVLFGLVGLGLWWDQHRTIHISF